MSNIAVKNHSLENATTFKEIIGVYIEVLTDRSQDGDGYYLYGHEKEVAKDSLSNLADMLDVRWRTGQARRKPISVEEWGKANRTKYAKIYNEVE